MHLLSCLSCPSCPSRPSCLSWLSCLFCVFALVMPVSAAAQQVTGGIVGGGVGGTVTAGVQPPRDVVQPVGRSAIRGRVLAADSGLPMRRAAVNLFAPELRGNRTTSTDTDGRYEFRQLPAGRYSLTVSKPAYVNWAYGQTRPGGSGKPLVLSDNQIADNVNLSLPRGSVIVGRVVDEFGEPLTSAGVTAIRQQFSGGQRRLVSMTRAQTNDIGEYRLFGLTPGQYYVSATAQTVGGAPIPANVSGASGDRSGFAPTFYPAAAEVASAQRLTVGVGQTLTGVDVSLVPTRLASISGIAIDSQGRSLTGGGVQTTQRGLGNMGIGNFGGSVRPDGTFTVANVAPGEYVLRANFPRAQTPGTAPVGPPEFAVAVVTVNGDDITGVRLTPIAQVSITGRIVFDDTAAAQTVKASTMRVMSQVLNPEDNLVGFGGGIPDSTVHDDFTFVLKAFPGRLALRAFAPVLPGGPNAAGGWQLKSIRANGLDVTDSGVDLGSQGLSGVEIEMTSRVQQLSGTVFDAKGAAVSDYTIVVFPQDRARWLSAVNRYFAVSRLMDDGKFKIASLPPGEYYVVALDGIDLNDWQDPDTLEGLSRIGTAFALTPGDSRTIDLKLSAQ